MRPQGMDKVDAMDEVDAMDKVDWVTSRVALRGNTPSNEYCFKFEDCRGRNYPPWGASAEFGFAPWRYYQE